MKAKKVLKLSLEFEQTNDLNKTIASAKPPIFWKDKEIVKKQLKAWDINILKKIVLEINNTELLCKKNPQISKTIFLGFFTRLCKIANNSS